MGENDISLRNSTYNFWKHKQINNKELISEKIGKKKYNISI